MVLGSLGALALLAALAVGGAAYRLKQGPLSFDSFAERVSSALEQQFGNGYDVDVQHAQLEWGDTPLLAVSGVTIRDAKGNLVVAAPQAEIGFDVTSLAFGRLVPRHIDFVGLAVALTIDPDGSVSISATGSDAPEAAGPVQPTDTSFGPASLLDALSDQMGPLGVLERGGVRDGRLRINDRRRGLTLVYDRLALSYAKGAGSESRLSLAANGPSGPWSAAIAFAGRKGGERTIGLDTDNLAVSDLLGIAEPGTIPVTTDMPIDARLRLTLGPDNAVTNADGRITGGQAMVLFDDPDAEPLFVDQIKGDIGWDSGRHALAVRHFDVSAGDTRFEISGSVTPPTAAGDFWQVNLTSQHGTLAGEGPKDKPVPIDQAVLQGRIPIGLGGLIVDRFAVSGPGVGLQMSGTVGRADGFEGLKLDVATTTRMSVRSVLAFWPSFIVPDVRSYMVQSLQDGAVQAFRYTTSMSPAVLADALAKRPVPAEAVALETTVTGGVMRPAPGLPLLSEVEAVGKVTGRTVVVDVRRALAAGGAGQPIVLSNGRYEVADTSQHPANAKVSFDASGTAEAAMAVARSEALKPYVPPISDQAIVKGHVDLSAKVSFPLQPQLGPNDVVVQLQGGATGFSAENIFGKERLDNGTLALTNDRSGLLLKGDGKIGGSPASFELRQPTGAPLAEALVSVTLDDAARARRGIKLPQVVGPVEAKISVKDIGGPKPTPRVDLDLTRANIIDLLPGWVKTPGKAAKASFRLDTDAEGSTLDEFTLDGGGPVSAKGQLRIGADGSIAAARLSSLRLSAGDDMRVDLERQGASSRVTLRGSSVDARPVLKALMSPGASPMASPGDFDLDLKVNAIQGLNGETITGVDGRMGIRAGEFRDFRLSGRFAGAPVSGQLARDESGRLGIVVESANAGAFFRFFDIYRRMQGGAMLVQITGAAPVMSGTLVVNHFVLQNEPALARSAAPNQQNNVAFTKLKSGFTVGGGRLAIRDATMWGQSVGGTLEGYMDFRVDKADFSGTFVPAYGLNNIFNQVPIVGPILGGGQHEGLFAVNFRISGKASQPTVAINPLSAVAPGFLRKFFGVIGPSAGTGSTPAPPAPTPER
ncbi:hypothetical protein SLNSH_07360 [Alsobacter soli]|uniref:DUF3971 domain-containing protein n=1 Tax=Alsobacter soli TaxID=2109933 RepID=A0A2T1HVT9_9HYPH|nr:AsmA-like C-terminal region-containing protein [Alsobacter soli]PSC05787.1 hypothetical protein SLNSH_07360 [Alsobacter soli]